MANTERNAHLHYTWQTTPYLTSRTQQLHSTLTDIQDTKPVSLWTVLHIDVISMTDFA